MLTTSVSAARRLVSFGALAVALALASCATPPPPAPPPPPPSISLSSKLVSEASVYRSYVDRATAISPAFTGGGDVAQSLRTGGAYSPQQLIRGAIAYGAIVALQDPAFVAGVRTYANDPVQRREIAHKIMQDPAYAVGIAGSASAAGLIVETLGGDGKRLLDQGKAVKQAAYDVQRSSWSKSDVQGRDARLALAKQLSATAQEGDLNQTQRLQSAVTGGGLNLTAATKTPPYTALVVRSLGVAALAALGYADDASLPQAMALTTETNGTACLNTSKLNVYQCLAVSKPHYEDVFCLGQHVMMDAGLCLMKGVGAPVPLEIRTAPLVLKAAVPVKGKPARKPAKKR